MRGLLTCLIAVVLLEGCFEEPTYPLEPQIEFGDIYFGDDGNPNTSDSLVLTISFKDGDGDLGLDDRDLNDERYQEKFYFVVSGTGTIVNYKLKRTNPTFSYLPEFTSPFNCTNWDIIRNADNSIIDTLYFELNPNYHNIIVDFQVKNPDGSFTSFDPTTYFIYPNCSVNLFNGRFPILSKDPSKESPLEGNIQYSMKSSVFNLLFSIKTLRLRIYIYDRDLNKSNVIETPEFTLQSVRR